MLDIFPGNIYVNVAAGVVIAVFLYFMYKTATKRTSPPGNQPNTGERYTPPPKPPVVDYPTTSTGGSGTKEDDAGTINKPNRQF